MATIEVYQCIEIRGMDEALRNSAFVVETIIFLFPIGYLYWRERQEKLVIFTISSAPHNCFQSKNESE